MCVLNRVDCVDLLNALIQKALGPECSFEHLPDLPFDASFEVTRGK